MTKEECRSILRADETALKLRIAEAIFKLRENHNAEEAISILTGEKSEWSPAKKGDK